MISTEAAAGRVDRDEINVVAMVQLAWRYRFFIVAVAVIVGLAAIAVSLTTTPVFRAEVVVTAARDENMGPGSSLANQLGGLASIAGIKLGAGGPGPEAQAVLHSRGLTEEFVKKYRLVPQLLPNETEHATVWFAVNKFRDTVLKITEDQDTQTTTIQTNWRDPAVAARWANDYVALANEILRSRAMTDSSRNIAYLKDQIDKTDVVELQRVMYTLVEAEMRTLMLANARAEYAFTVVDPGVTPERRVWPRRALMVLSGGVIGGIIGFFLALAHSTWRRYRAAG